MNGGSRATDAFAKPASWSKSGRQPRDAHRALVVTSTEHSLAAVLACRSEP